MEPENKSPDAPEHAVVHTRSMWPESVEINGAECGVWINGPLNHHYGCILQQAFWRLEKASPLERDIAQLATREATEGARPAPGSKEREIANLKYRMEEDAKKLKLLESQ